VVVAASLAFPARVARELDPALPLVTVHLQPSVLLSAEQPPKLPGAHIQAHWPRWLKRFLIQTIHRVVDRVYARPLNAFRAKLGLSSPVRGVMERYWHSPDLGIGLFPDWFAPPAADWPVPFQLVGFPLYDESHHQPLPPSAEAFLQSGEPPVVFTFGSAMARGERLFRTALDVCRGLGRRGLFLARFEDQIPRPLPPAIHYERYIPFSQVFPRACAVVHHGGIGTTAQALAAGIPQVVIALAHDQYDNGDRIERLGVGRMLPRNRLNARRLRQALESLIGSASASGQARAIAERFKGERPLESAADLIESLAARRGIPLQTGRPLAGGDTPR
jgi:rhamnosyltransferase subunit B